MEIKKNYRKDNNLRKSFNNLTKKTFGFDFEDWYKNGFWNDNYIPYSIIENDKVIANVSVNLIDIIDFGQVKHYIQLGTVMTDEKYRNKGLIRILMNEIDKDFSEISDGMFLFANDSVVNLYPKFGFSVAEEYRYSKSVAINSEASVVSVPMDDKSNWQKVINTFENNIFHGNFDMFNNVDLVMFYLTSFMKDSVYYERKSGAYVIADVDGDNLFLHSVLSSSPVTIDEIVKAFGKNIKKVTLGFTPSEFNNWTIEELKEDDTTLFVRNFTLEDKKVMFPTLSHA
ncbi:MAG: GNAT family N-acetyltransferase [Ruminococcus sp.]|nr:GNAT family N-acetyltransferase [Ruminococcus sp.]